MRIEHNVACSHNLHCLNSLWFVTKWVPSIDTYLNWTGGGAIDTLPTQSMVARCITCCEAFPGLQLQSLPSAECVRCYCFIHRQTRFPRLSMLYSLLRLAPLMIIICLVIIMYRWYVRFGPGGRFRLGHSPKHKTSMPQAESLRRCRGTRQHDVHLPAAHSPKQRRLTNRADFETKMPWQPHTPRWNVARTHDAMPRTLSPPLLLQLWESSGSPRRLGCRFLMHGFCMNFMLRRLQSTFHWKDSTLQPLF